MDQISKLKLEIQEKDEFIYELKPYKDICSTSERKLESYERDNSQKNDEVNVGDIFSKASNLKYSGIEEGHLIFLDHARLSN
ncbi:19757_t:CDS:2 [Funneliformis geosporum]|uniref:8267_t:CDS:1 n=1 Tax=Funneliformis geosporum TaxID=1117311 RepID=A0A9W4WMF3_9GLOM|nr:8267_t:CDS:2 [Funneliformis geosporum]CAI2173929.1 19757_t:CDS:2 [Funneliformis geosporum]